MFETTLPQRICDFNAVVHCRAGADGVDDDGDDGKDGDGDDGDVVDEAGGGANGGDDDDLHRSPLPAATTSPPERQLRVPR